MWLARQITFIRAFWNEQMRKAVRARKEASVYFHGQLWA